MQRESDVGTPSGADRRGFVGLFTHRIFGSKPSIQRGFDANYSPRTTRQKALSLQTEVARRFKTSREICEVRIPRISPPRTCLASKGRMENLDKRKGKRRGDIEEFELRGIELHRPNPRQTRPMEKGGLAWKAQREVALCSFSRYEP